MAFEVDEAAVWLGGHQGVLRWEPNSQAETSWRLLDDGTPWDDGTFCVVSSIVPGWAATKRCGVVQLLDGGRYAPRLDVRAHDIEIRPGEVWVAAEEVLWRGPDWRRVRGIENPRALDGADELWVASDEALWKEEPDGGWERWKLPEDVGGVLRLRSADGVWVAGREGLLHLDTSTGAWTLYRLPLNCDPAVKPPAPSCPSRGDG